MLQPRGALLILLVTEGLFSRFEVLRRMFPISVHVLAIFTAGGLLVVGFFACDKILLVPVSKDIIHPSIQIPGPVAPCRMGPHPILIVPRNTQKRADGLRGTVRR